MDDNTASFVYSSHFLEHLSRDDGRLLLRETYRILSPGGTLRLVVPDLEFAVDLYRHGETERFLRYFFHETPHSPSAHRYMYDFESLADVLEDVGFMDITKQGYGLGTMPDLLILDNRPEESLYIEALK